MVVKRAGEMADETVVKRAFVSVGQMADMKDELTVENSVAKMVRQMVVKKAHEMAEKMVAK